jgi:hypothetical protein
MMIKLFIGLLLFATTAFSYSYRDEQPAWLCEMCQEYKSVLNSLKFSSSFWDQEFRNELQAAYRYYDCEAKCGGDVKIDEPATTSTLPPTDDYYGELDDLCEECAYLFSKLRDRSCGENCKEAIADDIMSLGCRRKCHMDGYYDSNDSIIRRNPRLPFERYNRDFLLSRGWDVNQGGLNDIGNCGRTQWRTRRDIETACRYDEDCIAFTMRSHKPHPNARSDGNGKYPWCLKRATGVGRVQGLHPAQDHDLFHKK